MIIQVQPQANSQPPVPLPEDVYRLQTSRLAGFNYYGQDIWLHQMKLGEELTLVAEPANPYDQYAVRIHWQDKHIGYLPRTSNHVVSRLLRQGAPIKAAIAWLDPRQERGTPMTLHVLAPKF
ncbi:MAG: HIRAN domain-containing protein [Akkermansiaceae bacterium]|nr:HIRAN domain-containing protein [Akkermansiaceae bacterium]